MSKRQPEKTSIARRKLLAGGVVLAGSAAFGAPPTASAGAADENLPPYVPAWMRNQARRFSARRMVNRPRLRRTSTAGLALRRRRILRPRR